MLVRQTGHFPTTSPNRFVGVYSSQIDNLWPEVSSILEPALYGSGFGLDDVLESLKSRDMQLWVFSKEKISMCVVTQIVNFPKKKTFCLLFVGGEDLNSCIDYADIFEKYATDNKCDDIEALGRPGFSKFSDYKKVKILFRKVLNGR